MGGKTRPKSSAELRLIDAQTRTLGFNLKMAREQYKVQQRDKTHVPETQQVLTARMKDVAVTRIKKRKGRASTILTDLTDEDTGIPALGVKQLLG